VPAPGTAGGEPRRNWASGTTKGATGLLSVMALPFGDLVAVHPETDVTIARAATNGAAPPRHARDTRCRAEDCALGATTVLPVARSESSIAVATNRRAAGYGNRHNRVVKGQRQAYDAHVAALLREIIVDCNDPRVVADFWGHVLGWTVQEDDGLLWMSASGRPFPDLLLVFVPVPERKSVKNRIHLDVNPVGCDQAEEVERIVALGARRVDVGQGESPWVVLADPEGNEFCVLSRRSDAT